MAAVSSLAGAEEEEPAGAVRQRRPCGRGEAQRRTQTLLRAARLGAEAVHLPGLPQRRVLEAAQRQSEPDTQLQHLDFTSSSGFYWAQQHGATGLNIQ